MGLFLFIDGSVDGSIFQSCGHTPRTNEVEVPPSPGEKIQNVTSKFFPRENEAIKHDLVEFKV